jgi:hypothetical protein
MEKVDGFQTVAHARTRDRIRRDKYLDILRFNQQRLTVYRQVVRREFHLQAKIHRFTERVRNGLDDIQFEIFAGSQVGIHQHPMIEVIIGEGLADVVGCQSHQDIKVRRPVYCFAAQTMLETFQRIQGLPIIARATLTAWLAS